MSKMNFKSTLWALAFACAAVSCSDELADGPNNNEGNELNGESAQIMVAVNTSITTRAKPGEEGDGDEPGSLEESYVNDVAVFLFRNYKDGKNDTENDFTFDAQSVIKAAGWATNENGMQGGSTEHSFYKEITVTSFNPSEDFIDGGAYGVIAVTNLGQNNYKSLLTTLGIKGTTDVSTVTGDKLADHIYTGAIATNKAFIMSTHKMKVEGIGESVVIPKYVTGSDKAPSVNVFVERLAAKIRINEHEDNNFVYKPTNNVNDRVLLDKVAIVNQLSSGSYLIKRVTKAVDGGSTAIPDNDPADGDIYLGDELLVDGTAATNFVIDPWTRLKTKILTGGDAVLGTSGSKVLKYTNQYKGGAGNQYTTNGKQLYSASSDFKSPTTICYTMENTTGVDAQQNGYSTGAIFEATYLPATWVAASTTETTGVDKDEDTKAIKSGTGSETYEAKDFYLYKDVVYEDKDAVFAYALAQVIPDGTTSAKYYTYKDFATALPESFKISEFKASLTAKATDPFGYIDYLNSLDDDATDIMTFTAFLASEDMHKKDPEGLVHYVGGKCYYPYWIRHANNGQDDVMGIMEFGIVRNNIYDLKVTQVKGYGDVVLPNPDTPDEKKDLKLDVVIYVKDWTLRKNDDIIL